MITPTEGRLAGEARKSAGLNLAALHKEHSMKRAQLAMLEAAMSRIDRRCSSDDMPDDLGDTYRDGGKWVGATVHGLAVAHVIERIGNVKSARPSRHGTEVKLWRVHDDVKAYQFMQMLRASLDRNPMRPGEQIDGTALLPLNIMSQKGSPAVAATGPRRDENESATKSTQG